MRILNLNAWWPLLDGAKETAAERNSVLFHKILQLEPDVITMQECDPVVLSWLIQNGYQVVLGLMSSSEPLVYTTNEQDSQIAQVHLSVGIASRMTLGKPRCHVYHPAGFWPKRIEEKNAEHWQKVGGAVLNGNLNCVLLVAEVEGITISVTHGPWDITRKPKNCKDQQGGLSEHQRQGILNLTRVIRDKEPKLDIVAGDSNTHTGYDDSMFSRVGAEFEMRAAIPRVAGSLDRHYFPHHKLPWAKILSPDNVVYGRRLRLISQSQFDGVSDHRGQLVDLEKI